MIGAFLFEKILCRHGHRTDGTHTTRPSWNCIIMNT